MILVVCADLAGCGHIVRILGDVREVYTLVGPSSEYWPDKYRCAKCGGPAVGAHEPEVDPASLVGYEIRNLEAQEMFRAQQGLGLPEEQVCTRAAVEEVLRENPIRRIAGHDVAGSDRFVLEWMELWDGTKVYFAASSHGATVNRIVPPQSHTARVLREKNDG